MANFLIQGQTTREISGVISSFIELIRNLMVIYILTKFGADLLIFVDARVLTRKLWTDRHLRTVSDHDSSPSTLCSGELIKGIPLFIGLTFPPLLFYVYRDKSSF